MIIRGQFLTTIKGEKLNLYTIKNSSGAYVQITDIGASIVSLCVHDKNGNLRDVVLSYSKVQGFETGSEYFGATVGRCCNRIRRGKFTLDGKQYSLALNDGENHLHGGVDNFSRRIWRCETVNENSLKFSLFSPDGDEGYPADLSVETTYTFTEDNRLVIEYAAASSGKTLCNLTNHTYFNLNGHNGGEVYGHMLRINADSFLPTDGGLIPTGEIQSVQNTPLDFRTEKAIGTDICANYEPLKLAGGYDHCYILNGGEAAEVYSPESGIALKCTTTQPALQLYTANFVNVSADMGKGGTAYGLRHGLCLESQGFVDAVNHPSFPQVTIDEKKNFYAETVYAFSLKSNI